MSNVVFVADLSKSDVPPNLDYDMYCAGYKQGWTSNHLPIFRKSYAEGFRRAKLEIRQYWLQNGVVPISKNNAKIKITSI
jgi:hypothetical protein